jgi:hypothetical protein
MAIFKAPKITTIQRLDLLLDVSELVYDIDQQAFYGGDGITVGGNPIGSNSGFIVERIEITEQNIIDKYVFLTRSPLIPSGVTVDMEGGIKQVNGVDYQITGNKLSWDGLGLDGFIDDTDVLLVQY